MVVLKRFLSRDWNSEENDILKKVSLNSEALHLTPNNNELPPVIHQTLKLDWMPVDGRLIVVGDVHGCRSDLEALINKIRYRPRKDCLMFVGDLVGKGPDSRGVLDVAIQYGALCVRGSHDDTALQVYQNRFSRKYDNKWAAENAWAKEISFKHAAYLSAMPFSLTIPELNIVITHAGLVPGAPLWKQNLVDLYKMRYLRRRWTKWEALEKYKGECKQWADVWNGPEHVIFGHDSLRGLQLTKYATGLDTGCVYGGELTACVIPAGKLLNSCHEPPIRNRCVPRSKVTFDPKRKNLGMEFISVPSTYYEYDYSAGEHSHLLTTADTI